MSETDPHQQTNDKQTKSAEALSAEHHRTRTEQEAYGRQLQSVDQHAAILQGQTGLETEGVPHESSDERWKRQVADGTSAPVSRKEILARPAGPASGDGDSSTREQTMINGLLSILASTHEEVRSYRVLLFSNLLLAFTIPLSALAVQDRELFRVPRLWGIPHPDWCLFFCWALGVLSMAVGLAFILPSMTRGSEALASHRAKEAARFLAQWKTTDAIESLLKAIDQENERLRITNWCRIPFFLAFVVFLICVAIEFGLMLFS